MSEEHQHPSHEWNESGQHAPITTKYQFRVWAEKRGVPVRELSGDRLRCLDLSLCPPVIQALFDSAGDWQGPQE